MSDTNEYEERNRAAKAYRLVRWVEERQWDAADVERLSADDWIGLAHVAKVNPPSDRTKAIVLHVLRDRSDG